MAGSAFAQAPARLAHAFDRLRSSYWFVPSTMFAAAVALAFGALEIDRRWIDAESDVGWLYLGSAQGARSVLGAIAGSIVTVAGVVFSITIVTLAQASTQFGPRILRKFMRDVGNQVVLGTFVATFVYCLLVLRTVRGEEEGPFVPHAAVALAVVLAVLSIGVLIYFIHHVAASLQAPNVIAGLGADLAQALDGVRGPRNGSAHDAMQPPADATAPARAVRAEHAGYVQVLDHAALLAAANERDCVVHVRRTPGDYAIDGAVLVEVRPAERCDDDLAARIRGAFIVGAERTSEQDVRYALEQAVEIALRALSPGINDPFTAANCIDWLGSALARLARVPSPAAQSGDVHGRLRVVQPTHEFPALLDVAFEQIGLAAARSPWVMRRLLATLLALAEQEHDHARSAALAEHADRLRRIAERAVDDHHDLDAIRRGHAAILARTSPQAAP